MKLTDRPDRPHRPRRLWLLPLVPLYALGLKLRSKAASSPPTQRLNLPVVSIGNLSTGGTGKTPFAIALAKLLTQAGWRVDVLSRGYGRSGAAVERVDTQGTAERFGDEPLLIAREANIPVYVGTQRWQAGQLAEREADSATGVHLLDDGFQHRVLYRDIDIVLVNSEDLDDYLLPAGNLRESFQTLARATILAVPSGDDRAVLTLRKRGLTQPIWRFHRQMVVPTVNGPAVAFCGIARPQQFFQGLEDAQVHIAARHAFPDHHRFQPRNIRTLEMLLKRAKALTFITTVKDRIRLGSLEQALQQAAPLVTADLRVVFEEEQAIVSWLDGRLK